MSNQYEQRILVNSAITNYINQLMINNNLSPSMVEDALYKIIANLQPLVIEKQVVKENPANVEELLAEKNKEQEEVEDGSGSESDTD